MKKVLITVLLLSLTSLAQTVTLIDDSPSDSPIKVSGVVKFDPNNSKNATCKLKGHNSGPQTIVAWRQDIDVYTPQFRVPMVYRNRHDHFFKDEDMLASESLQAGADYQPEEIACSVFTAYQGVNAIHVKVLWVQYIDGSTWGSADAQAYMMAQRTNAVQFLNQLKAAYASGGEAAFKASLVSVNWKRANLRAEMELDEAHSAQIFLRQMPDVATQLAEVNRKLSMAASRANWIK